MSLIATVVPCEVLHQSVETTNSQIAALDDVKITRGWSLLHFNSVPDCYSRLFLETIEDQLCR